MTKPISRKMAVDCLLYRLRHFSDIRCGICNDQLMPSSGLFSGGEIQFDHIHADVFGGPHEYQNLRPVHAECHKKKTARDVKDNAKIKRIRGETKQCKGRPMAGTKRSKFKRKLDGTVVLR